MWCCIRICEAEQRKKFFFSSRIFTMKNFMLSCWYFVTKER